MQSRSRRARLSRSRRACLSPPTSAGGFAAYQFNRVLMRSGELPAVNIGGTRVWRVDKRKLDSYLEKLEAETASWAKAHPF
jgi:hypothetical protein